MPTISRRLASAGIADPGDLKSPSLPGASPGSPTNLRSSSCGSANRRVVNREQQTGSTQDRTALGVQVSPRRPIIVRKEETKGMFDDIKCEYPLPLPENQGELEAETGGSTGSKPKT